MQKGQGIVEYALTLVLIGVVVLVVLAIIGPLLGNVLRTESATPTMLDANWQEMTVPPGYQGKCYRTFNYSDIEVICIPEGDL